MTPHVERETLLASGFDPWCAAFESALRDNGISIARRDPCSGRSDEWAITYDLRIGSRIVPYPVCLSEIRRGPTSAMHAARKIADITKKERQHG